MASISVRLKDRLEGTLNFNTWNSRILNFLEEQDLDGYVSYVVEEPTFDARYTIFKKTEAKNKRIIYDLVKDNLMSVITPLKTAKECFDTLTNIYEKKASSQKRELKNKL